MDKVLATVLMIVASVISVVIVINVVYPAITSSAGSINSASSLMGDRIRSQIEIIHATGELDSVGSFADTDSDSNFDIFIWVKNVGSERIVDVPSCDVFIANSLDVWSWIPHTDYAAGANPQWSYTLENGSSNWTKATTAKIEVNYGNTTLASGEYSVKVLIPNGVSDDYFFSM